MPLTVQSTQDTPQKREVQGNIGMQKLGEYPEEAWTLTLREEQRFRVFENKFLRNIFGAKRDDVTGEWRKLHNAELHALYSSPDIIRNIKSRRLRLAAHVARMGESSNAYRMLVGRPKGKRPLERPRRRWEDNIKMDLREVGYDDRDWITLAQDRDRWRSYVGAAISLYRRPPEAADSLDRPPWNVAKRRRMASAMAPEADLLGGGVSPRTDRGAWGKLPKQECAEQSDGITVFRISPMASLMLHRCRTGAISLQRWWQSPSPAISESDWFLYRAGISRRMASCTVVSWRYGSTKISQNFASVAQTTTYKVAMTAIDPSSTFVPISLQRDVIVVYRSDIIKDLLHRHKVNQEQKVNILRPVYGGDAQIDRSSSSNTPTRYFKDFVARYVFYIT
ncbi:hypothetical protein ANN_23547 [Periplaneta americana]|uniref:Uncharacterized protein n=1 Tax=Periplaneta americana TaxID=6978 RepID=A0ABQ8SMK9_PERAM|nr:hypothetical protein ANN_23547 [Periplaneta americana]